MISDLLNLARQSLLQVTDSPSLEAELLLAQAMQVSRIYLHTWPMQIVSTMQQKTFMTLLARRVAGEPMAYILGYRDFWSLRLKVTSDILIPRPETELLVEIALATFQENEVMYVADLGTGSGAVALSLAKERSQWKIIAIDKSAAALAVARSNAENLSLSHVAFQQGDWCEALPKKKFDLIVSNPPYIAAEDQHLIQGDVRFEPKTALIAADNGLAALKIIAQQARAYLKTAETHAGWLMLEHGYQQGEMVRALLMSLHYSSVRTYKDLQNNERVTVAQFIL